MPLIRKSTQLSDYKLRYYLKAYRCGTLQEHLAAARRRAGELSEEQVAWLTSNDHLNFQLDWNLVRRVEEFNQRWLESAITMYRLRKLFAEKKIKQRVLLTDISLTDSQLRR